MKKRRTDQLRLGSAKTKKEYWYNFLNWLNGIERNFSVMPFWRTGVNVFCFVSILFSIFTSLVVNLGWGDQISEKIPLFYSQQSSNWISYDKSYLYFISMLVWILQFMIFYFSFRIFPTDKRLSVMTNILLTVSSLLFLLTISQIYTLQLI